MVRSAQFLFYLQGTLEMHRSGGVLTPVAQGMGKGCFDTGDIAAIGAIGFFKRGQSEAIVAFGLGTATKTRERLAPGI